jgi:HPt (histidine-containing phosphotransfer) domain-containing protein
MNMETTAQHNAFHAMHALLALVPEAARQGMVQLYRKAIEEIGAQVDGHIAAGDDAAFLAAVHKIAGSAAMMQDRALSDTARAAEHALRQGRVAEAKSLWSEAQVCAARTVAELDAVFPRG